MIAPTEDHPESNELNDTCLLWFDINSFKLKTYTFNGTHPFQQKYQKRHKSLHY